MHTINITLLLLQY